MICALKECGKEFPRSVAHPHKRYCSLECRKKSYRMEAKRQRLRYQALHPTPRKSSKPKRPRLLCKWCGMRHRTDLCPRKGDPVKKFGTVVNGQYVPPPGVVVRYITLPHEVFGEELTRMLKLEKEATK